MRPVQGQGGLTGRQAADKLMQEKVAELRSRRGTPPLDTIRGVNPSAVQSSLARWRDSPWDVMGPPVSSADGGNTRVGAQLRALCCSGLGSVGEGAQGRGRSAPPQLPPAKRRREAAEDDPADDFVVDSDDQAEADWRAEMRSITGYDPSRSATQLPACEPAAQAGSCLTL